MSAGLVPRGDPSSLETSAGARLCCVWEVVMMLPASWLCLAAVTVVTPRSHQLQGAEFLRGWNKWQMCQAALTPPGQRDVTLLWPCPTGFPYKPPLSKRDFSACPRGWEERGCVGRAGLGCSGGRGTRWCPWDDASPRVAGLLAAAFLAACTSRLPALPSCLHAPGLLLRWPSAARFQKLTDAFFSKAWTDVCKQLSECI